MNFEEKSEDKKKVNIKKVVTIISIIILIIAVIATVVVYNKNKDFREFVDTHILKKNLSEDDVISIEIDPESSRKIFAYNDTIAVLEKNILTQYSSFGKKEKEVTLEINDPIYDTTGEYLVIAEKDRQKIYKVESGSIKWEKNIEGNIKRVHINKNGYVAIIITGTTYKSVISVYNPEGKELFKTYLSNTNALDVEISYDNKYVSFVEVNTSGTLIQSTIKTISIEKAQESPSESIINTFTAPVDNLLLSIKYQDKNKLICRYQNSIHVLQDGEDETLIQWEEKERKNNFADIELNNYAFLVTEVSSGLFKADNVIEFINITTQKRNNYTIEGVAKEIYSCEDVVAANLGSEVYFINTNGWLIKKYTSKQEVRDIVLGRGIAGIVYRNKIEFIRW